MKSYRNILPGGPATRSLTLSLGVLLGLASSSSLVAQGGDRVDLVFGFLDVPERVGGAPGASVEIEVLASLHTLVDPEGNGIGGWSLSIGVEGADILYATTEGLEVRGPRGIQPMSEGFFNANSLRPCMKVTRPARERSARLSASAIRAPTPPSPICRRRFFASDSR